MTPNATEMKFSTGPDEPLNGAPDEGLWNRLWTKTFGHGIHPPEHKELTRERRIRRLPFPPEMIVPLSQHTGAPAKPIVHEDQEVVRGEPIAEADGFVSVPMHAPATGKVSKIGLAKSATGRMIPSIFIKLYPGASQEILYGAPLDISKMTPREIIKAVQATGVVGLGGAAFPTHVKMAVPEGKSVDTIVVNGCECEPYLTTDHRVMLEMPEDIFKGIQIVMRAMGAQRAIIGIESNKPDAIAKLRAMLPKDGSITVEEVQAKYPQGAEKMLVKALLGREIPSGGLPIDAHVGVFNVATLAQIGAHLPLQQGLIERVITVTGHGVKRPGNYLIPLGAPIRFVLDQVGLTDDAAEIILGGPMMGMAIGATDIPITKGVTGILVLTRAEVEERNRKVYPCIRCGMCVDACPIYLNPAEMGRRARVGQYEAMRDKLHLFDCFECGCCSYVCPSGIPLVQMFRVAKGVLRERKVS